MKIMQVNSKNSFNGLLVLSGPDKSKKVVVNTDNVSTIVTRPFFDKAEDAAMGIGVKCNAVITTNSGTKINTYLPIETVISAYKKAEELDEYNLDLKFDPIGSK